MKKLVWITCAGWIFINSFSADANAQSNREYRRIERQSRKAQKQEAKLNMDYKRMDRENAKQLKKMHRESRKANKGKYDTNELGNVYEGL